MAATMSADPFEDWAATALAQIVDVARGSAGSKAIRQMRYIAKSCSHANDDGGPLGEHWDEHLHDPAAEGGHKYCGPCVAFRTLYAISGERR